MGLLWTTSQQSRRKRLGCLNARKRQSNNQTFNEGWNTWTKIIVAYKHASVLQFSITTRLTMQVLAVNQAKCYMDAFLGKSQFLKWVLVHKKHPHQNHGFPMIFSHQHKCFTRMFAKWPCTIASNKKRIVTRKLTFQNSKKQIMRMSNNPNWIIKEGKFPLQKFSGLVLLLLKKPYQKTVFWYKTLGQTKRKCFIAWDYVNSHPDIPYPIYKSRMRIETWSWIDH